MIAKQLELRVVPRLKFIPDVSFDKASEMDALMRRADVARDLRPMTKDLEENNSGKNNDDDVKIDQAVKTDGA
jgi:hypothetical protein